MGTQQEPNAGDAGDTAERVVLGKYPENIQEALDSGGVFFDPGTEVRLRLESLGIDLWRVEESFLQQQEDAGRRFDLTLRGLDDEEVENLLAALGPLADGNTEDALRILGTDELPEYAKQAQWLLDHGYVPKPETDQGWIYWDRP